MKSAHTQGRLDVLAFRVIERVAKHVEKEKNLPGLWDAIQSDVEQVVNDYVPVKQVTIPKEAVELMQRLKINL